MARVVAIACLEEEIFHAVSGDESGTVVLWNVV
jgi:hypothetical protein